MSSTAIREAALLQSRERVASDELAGAGPMGYSLAKATVFLLASLSPPTQLLDEAVGDCGASAFSCSSPRLKHPPKSQLQSQKFAGGWSDCIFPGSVFVLAATLLHSSPEQRSLSALFGPRSENC